MTETLEQLLERLRGERGVYFSPPLPAAEVDALASSIRKELGLTIPHEYVRLLRVTNGISTRRGGLCDLQEVGERNAALWYMETESGASAAGDFEIRYKPLPVPRKPSYLWLGYNSGIGEYLYDLDSAGFWEIDTGARTRGPLNADRSLAGLLRHMVYR